MSQRVAIIVMNRDLPESTDLVVKQVREMGRGLETQVFVVECGSRPEGRSQYMTHYFRSRTYKGRYHGFNKGLEFAKQEGQFDYFWFVVNDISFPSDQPDVLTELVEVMEENPRMAIIGPAEPESNDYKGCHPQEGRRWHKVATVHGLAWLMRGTAIEEVGYCNPKFVYSWGASTELSYKLYRAGWFLAYSDTTKLTHQGGSTYGNVVPISRHEYHRRARNFAAKYFVRNYGPDWDREFSSVLPDDLEANMFSTNRQLWETPLRKEQGFLWFRKLGSRVKKALRTLFGAGS